MAELTKSESSAIEVALAAVAQLIHDGVHDFVLCPGSRSAPLATVLAAAETVGLVNLHIEIDERVAGFIALGFGKTGRPAAVITTSGSAIANLHPAVEEAAYSAVPLLVLAADRPAELRNVRASQTADHAAVLRGSVKDVYEIPAGAGQRVVGNYLRRALRLATGVSFASKSYGPVLVNIGFREPLTSEHSLQDLTQELTTKISALQLREADTFLSQKRGARNANAAPRTVIIAGPSNLWRTETEVSQFGSGLGQIPVLAEICSPLRALPQALYAHPELLHTHLAAEIERVIVIGHPTLTREVTALLRNPEVQVIVVDDMPTFTDISGNAACVIDLSELGRWVDCDIEWAQEWVRLAKMAQREIFRLIAASSDVTELIDQSASDAVSEPHNAAKPKITTITLAYALAESQVHTFVAASALIRDLNLYGPVPSREFAANRGLAGIDGNISTAIGLALGCEKPYRVVLGDLAFLHDFGSLLLGTHDQKLPDLQILVVDDGGGSLFASLEYGLGETELFNRVFRTGKEFNFSAFAEALGPKVRFQELSGDYLALKEKLAEVPQGIELLYLDLRNATKDELRENREFPRRKIREVLR